MHLGEGSRVMFAHHCALEASRFVETSQPERSKSYAGSLICQRTSHQLRWLPRACSTNMRNVRTSLMRGAGYSPRMQHLGAVVRTDAAAMIAL
jgi:hypothetical protein